MTPQDRQRRRVAIRQFVRDNVPFLPESARDLYPQARMCKELGLYSQTTFIGDVASRLWRLRKEVPAVDQERAQRIALAAPDLLAACKEAMFAWAHGVGSVTTSDDPDVRANADRNTREGKRIMRLIADAIAKAEGGAG